MHPAGGSPQASASPLVGEALEVAAEEVAHRGGGHAQAHQHREQERGDEGGPVEGHRGADAVGERETPDQDPEAQGGDGEP